VREITKQTKMRLRGGAVVGKNVETIVETPKADQDVSGLMPSIPRQTLSYSTPPLLSNLLTARRGLVLKGLVQRTVLSDLVVLHAYQHSLGPSETG